MYVFLIFHHQSFDTIAGVGGNGAIIHYRATPEKHGHMDRSKMLLLDSGAQYVDGTTDVTRTFHTGSPTEYQVVTYTRYFDIIIRDIIGIDYT